MAWRGLRFVGSRHNDVSRNRREAAVVLCAAFMVAFAARTAVAYEAQKVVDQILTLVNGEVITRTDLLWSIALDPKAPNPTGGLSSDILRQKLDVMIDERLIAQEAARIPAAAISPEDLTKKRAQLVSQFASEAAFRQRIESVGLTAAKLDDLIRARIQIDRFVDFRFRSFAFVREQEVQRYYDERLAPQIRSAGQVPPPIEQVREKISENLKQEKINQDIDRWLTSTRQRADIVQLAEP